MRFALLAVALATLVLPRTAAAFTAQNGMVVDPRPDGSFTVNWTGRSGAPNFWCAAGDYAMQVLSLPGNTRIYRYDPPVRRAGQGITFGLDAGRAQPSGLLKLQGGYGLAAAHARQFCFMGRGRT